MTDDDRDHDHLRLILDSIPALIGYVGRDRTYRLVNRGYGEWFGIGPEHMIGKRVDETLGAELYATIRDHVDAALRGEHVTFDAELPHRTGGVRHVEVSYTPHRAEDGAVSGYVAMIQDVSAERRAQEETRAAREQLEIVLRGIGDGVTLQDAAGDIVFANQAAAKTIGFETVTELLSKKTADIVDRFVLLSPDGSPMPVDCIPSRRAMRGEHVTDELVRFRGTDDPDDRWSIVSATPILDANGRTQFVVNIFKDVTRQRRADALLKASEQRFRFLSEASKTLASSLDYQTTLATVARLAVPTIADWATVDMLGPNRTLQRLAVAHVDPEKVELAHEVQKRWPVDMDADGGVPRVLRTREPEVYFEIPDTLLEKAIPDPELLAIIRELGLVSSMCVPLTVRGNAVGAITFISAESGRRYDDRDLSLALDLARRASTAIENAVSYREAQEANRLKDEFLATVSHELRTPLTAVLGWATMVRSRPNDAAYVAKGLDTIERNARAQAQLIEDLLDLSRVITGKLRLDVKPVDMTSIAHAALDTMGPAATAKGISLKRVLDPDAGLILGDPDRLQQIVNNLLTNAVKFTPKGGSIRVYLRRVDSSIELVVHDNGEGITAEFLPHVFERFRQADATATRTHSGLGLGLAITRSLVEMHGGTIEARSEGEGKGATFTVRIPIAPLRKSPIPEAHYEELERPMSLDGLRVLVCDDEPDTRELLHAVLDHSNAKVVTVSSAGDALARLRDERFDVLVSDIGMPGEDGYALIRRVRALPDEEGGRIPAVALTAFATTSDRTRALVAGYHAHVAKPIEPQELVVVIANLVGRLQRP